MDLHGGVRDGFDLGPRGVLREAEDVAVSGECHAFEFWRNGTFSQEMGTS